MKSAIISCLLFMGIQACSQTVTQKYIPARSVGKLPAISYGLGDDRLGGARMGYMDTELLFRVIDSTAALYHVQLSKYHTAYVDKAFLRFDSLPQEKPFYLTGSMLAKGDSTTDSVFIAMDAKLPYKSYMEIDPAKIVVEIFGVQSNTNWITQLKTLKEVKNVYYNQVEDDVLRVTIELLHRQHWGYSIGYKGKSLCIRVKRQPAKPDLTKLKIGIDAGHGGTNTGADGVRTGASEKTLTLQFAKALEKALKKKGVKRIVMTRTNDTTYDNKDRILLYQREDPDIVISLHLNSSGNPQTKGVSTYYKHIGYRPLTAAILKRMLELRLDEFGNVGSFNFMLNQPTDFINSLVEIAFLSNVQDEKKVVSPAFQTETANKIVLGISDWLKNLK
ncbi:N-acetylmuramoyl-L-alanine amidase [Sediminibacterium soli]|uniref:N-acetylmuramoyl-L-alanine amidase n=1 Tax=Sediminibacterium soli TaxID=2698829 RepID=UPI001379B589|nr:N-acetylmuramoyl-L-alanine amidase [Sediminibacterium soli]NCI45306.1 N-acetylmuramoyl-L-alanine amidase [Sediminibacterium soli]